jgi:hypothetical protein
MKAAAHPVVVGALAFVIAACGAHQPAGEGQAERESTLDITIEVENQNFYDARVYLLVFGERTRLGQVPSQTTRTFSFAAGPDQVRIEISFVGGGGFVTEPMSVSPGDQLVLQITPNAHQLRTRGVIGAPGAG